MTKLTRAKHQHQQRDLSMAPKPALAMLALLVAAAPGATRADSCHLREIDLCILGAASLLQNPNGLPLPASPEFERQCEQLADSSDCYENYARTCLAGQQAAFVELTGVGPLLEMGNELCSNGTRLNGAYTEHARCLRKVQRERQRECATDFQVAFEAVDKIRQFGDRMTLTCCNLKRMYECVLPSVEAECGPKARKLVDEMISRVVGRTLHVVCHSYEPDSHTCTRALPAAGTAPAPGGRQVSVLARIVGSYANARIR